MSYRKANGDDISDIAKRIKQLREAANESQEFLANKITTTKHTISKIETDATHLTLDNAEKIANHYNVSIDWICGRVDDMSIPDNILETLCKYIKFDTHSMSMAHPHVMPFISINQDLLKFLTAMDRAEKLKKDNVPEEVINAWIEKETQKILSSFHSKPLDDFAEYALLSNKHLSEEVMELVETAYKESV